MSSPLVREYQATDAQDIATCFNEQHDVWPGGFNNGKDLTAADIGRWHENSNAIAVFISIEDNHARAYCLLLRNITEEQDSCYVGLLGCSSRFHGRGHGRDLLRASVNRAIKEKIKRVDLHTWAGNLKAVPVYKKTGFMWVPKTEVLMQNFMPMVVLCPLAEDFFDGVDWYKVHDRELKQSEDFDEWQGMEVFTYRFNRDGKRLHVKINRKAGQVVFFEDDDIRIALMQPSEKPLKGRELKMTLEIEKKTNKYKSVSANGFSQKGAVCDFKSDNVVDREIKLEVPFSIDHKAEKGDDYEKYPAAGVDLDIDGKSLRLAIGLDTKPVVDLIFCPMHPVTASGEETSVGIELTNNTEKHVKCKLVADKTDCVTIENPECEMDVDCRCTILVKVKIEKSSVIKFAVDYDIDGETGRTEFFDVPVMVSESTGISSVTHTDKAHYTPVTRILRDRFMLVSSARGGLSELIDPSNSDKLIGIKITSFGPPFEPSNMKYAVYDQTVNDDGSIEMSAKVDCNPNLKHHQKITMLNSGWLAVQNSVENTSDKPVEIGMKFLWRLFAHASELNFVQNGKIISGMIVDESYPAEGEVPLERGEYDEGWMSFDYDGKVWGAVFGSDIFRVSQGWSGLYFQYQFENIPAKGRVNAETAYYYYGPGTYKDIRDGWLRLIKGDYGKSEIPEKRQLRELSSDPVVPVISGPSEIGIRFDSYRLVPSSGDIVILPDETLNVSDDCIHFEHAERGKPFDTKLTITPVDDSVGVSQIEIEADTDDCTTRTEITVLRTLERDKVKISKSRDEWTISNSLAEFKCDPGWGGGIHSFKTFDREWLKSPYPDKDTCFTWFNNFRGGIHPNISPVDRWTNLSKWETWEIAEHSQSCGGVIFKGVELKATLKSKDELKGATASMRYMLSESHRILKIEMEYASIGGGSVRMDNGLECFMDVHPENKTHQYFSYGTEHMRKIGKFAKYNKAGDWVIVQNDDTGQCATMLMKTEPTCKEQLWAFDMSKPYGQHIGGETALHLKSGENRKYEYFFTVCSSLDEAMKFRGLKNLGE